MKRILLVFAILLIAAMGSTVYAAEDGVSIFKVNPYGGAVLDIDSISWEPASGGYSLFLPANTDPAKMKIWASGSEEVDLDGKSLTWGCSGTALTEGKHTVSCGGKTYDLNVYYSAHIPAVHIKTKSGSLQLIHRDKSYKEEGIIRVYENGEMTLDKDLKSLKGRGNATWDAPKKPYNIKFDKKTDMFSMGAAKKWTLLANYYDETLVRNVYGWEYARDFGLPYSSEYQHVDLYINGNYLGNYVICESVEIGKERINIRDLSDDNEDANPGIDIESLPQKSNLPSVAIPLSGYVPGAAKWIDIPNSPTDISGGYLLEYELDLRFENELCGFVTDYGQPITIKEPEYASKDEVMYIRNYVGDAMNALYSDSGYNSKGKHYSEYIDMGSLVNMYILQELSSNIDAATTSFYAIKPQGDSKLIYAPIWDLDHSFGDSFTRGAIEGSNPTTWWANTLGKEKSFMLAAAYRHEEFRDAVHQRWTEILKKNYIPNEVTKVHSMNEILRASADMNILRWEGGMDMASADRTYSAKINVGESFIARRTKALSKGFAPNAAMLYYDANGGTGFIGNPYIASIGDTIKVISNDRGDRKVEPLLPTRVFAGWNTKPDGSGKTLQPGDSLTLTKKTTTLYAMWKYRGQGGSDPSAAVPMIYGNVDEYSTASPGSILKDSFYLNEDWFTEGSAEGRNDSLALLSMQLAASAIENDPSQNCATALGRLGFGSIDSRSSGVDGSSLGYTYGLRKIGKDVVAAVVVHGYALDRDSVKNAWMQDFTVNGDSAVSGEHYAYQKAAAQFDLTKLESEMKAMGASGKHFKFWVMGQSRGGAIASLLARRMKAEASDSEVFAYTFGSPATVDAELAAGSKDKYIHNYVCDDDLATLVPPWGMARYGVTYDLIETLQDRGISDEDVDRILEELGSSARVHDGSTEAGARGGNTGGQEDAPAALAAHIVSTLEAGIGSRADYSAVKMDTFTSVDGKEVTAEYSYQKAFINIAGALAGSFSGEGLDAAGLTDLIGKSSDCLEPFVRGYLIETGAIEDTAGTGANALYWQSAKELSAFLSESGSTAGLSEGGMTLQEADVYALLKILGPLAMNKDLASEKGYEITDDPISNEKLLDYLSPLLTIAGNADALTISHQNDTLIARLKALAPAPQMDNVAVTIPQPAAGDTLEKTPADLTAAVDALGNTWLSATAHWDTDDETLAGNKDHYLDVSLSVAGHSVPDDLTITINGQKPVSSLDVTTAEGFTVVNGTWTFAAGQPDDCAVAFDAGGHDQAPAAITLHKGTKLKYASLPSLKGDENHLFEGWQDASGTPAAELTVTGDMSLYARWTTIHQDDPVPTGYDGLNVPSADMKAGATMLLTSRGGEVVSWSSSDPKVALVSDGKVTALAKGRTVITATLSGGETQLCDINVTTSPKLSRKVVTVKKGKTKKVTIIGKAPGIDNKYKNTKKAKVTSPASAKTIRIKGLKKGKTTLKIRVGSTWVKLRVKVK